jgi:hypothetical protein
MIGGFFIAEYEENDYSGGESPPPATKTSTGKLELLNSIAKHYSLNSNLFNPKSYDSIKIIKYGQTAYRP